MSVQATRPKVIMEVQFHSFLMAALFERFLFCPACRLDTLSYSRSKPKARILSKVTANSLQALTGPEVSRRLRFPNFKTIGR